MNPAGAQVADALARLAGVRWSWSRDELDLLSALLGWPVHDAPTSRTVRLRTGYAGPGQLATVHLAGGTPREDVTLPLTGYRREWHLPHRTDTFAAAARAATDVLGEPTYRAPGAHPEIGWPAPGGIVSISDHGNGLVAALESSHYVAQLDAQRSRHRDAAALHGRTLRNLLRAQEDRYAADPEQLAAVAALDETATHYNGPLLDAERAAQDEVVRRAARGVLAEWIGVPDLELVMDRAEELPLLGFDGAADRLIALQPAPLAGTVHRLPDGTLAECGSAEFLADVLLHDERMHDALAAHPGVFDALRRAAAGGTLVVEYHELGVDEDGTVWTRALGGQGLDLAGLARL